MLAARFVTASLLLSALACASEPEPAAHDAGVTSPPGDGGIPVIGEDAACAMQSARAERRATLPLDIVFVIDNSGSMEDEIAAVRANINLNFAALIEASGADFRVIMLSQYGPAGTSVCIEPPLAGAGCELGAVGTNSARFFHYDVLIDSHDAFCKILDTFDRPSMDGRAPLGWQAFLRPDAQKAFVLITDDNASCTLHGDIEVSFGAAEADPFEDALMFHSALLARSPAQFGMPPDVRYQLYSFVGLSPHEMASQPWFPHEAISEQPCDTAPSPGTSYQALSVITDALRYPVCEGRGFDAVFRVLAQNVVESVKADCTFELPTAPMDQVIDISRISLRYEPGDDGATQQIEQVSDASACHARGFYIADAQLELCSEACTLVQSDPAAQIEVLYGCTYVPL
jgi:hypothetical protein